jgi:hypothetical protein
MSWSAWNVQAEVLEKAGACVSACVCRKTLFLNGFRILDGGLYARPVNNVRKLKSEERPQVAFLPFRRGGVYPLPTVQQGDVGKCEKMKGVPKFPQP